MLSIKKKNVMHQEKPMCFEDYKDPPAARLSLGMNKNKRMKSGMDWSIKRPLV